MRVESAEQCYIPTNIMVFHRGVFDTEYYHGIYPRFMR